MLDIGEESGPVLQGAENLVSGNQPYPFDLDVDEQNPQCSMFKVSLASRYPMQCLAVRIVDLIKLDYRQLSETLDQDTNADLGCQYQPSCKQCRNEAAPQQEQLPKILDGAHRRHWQ
jgi:hypothetical protein